MPSTIVNMLEAKSALSKLVAALESGAANEFTIVRNGRPAACLLPLDTAAVDRSRRIDVARGRFDVPAPRQSADDEVLRLMEGG